MRLMLLTPHALTGASIAVLIPNPAISIPLAIGSHFILDMVPHWQETLYPYKPTQATWIRLFIDLALSTILVFWVAQLHPNINTTIWITTFAANIPDLDSISSSFPEVIKNKIFRAYWNWHNSIQRETSSLLGLIPQTVLSFICLIISLPLNLKF